MIAPSAQRLISFVVGVFFLAAAVAKATDPAQSAGAISHAMRPLLALDYSVAIMLSGVLTVTEFVVGLLLVVAPRRTTRLIAAGLLMVFGTVLLLRFSSSTAPPCGCLGRALQSIGREHVWLDAARNFLFAFALSSVGFRTFNPHNGTAKGDRSHATASPRAFTILELLVVVLVISILIGLAFPVLSALRARSKVSRSLATQRQLAASIGVYSNTYQECFPHFAPLDNWQGPVQIRELTVMVGYFSAHMKYWPEAFGHDDKALITAAVDTLPDLNAPGSLPLFASNYWLTPTIAADPAAFSEPAAGQLPITRTLLRGVRWHEVTFPSQKGLLIDMNLWSMPERQRAMAVAFVDGSAAALDSDAPPEPVVAMPPSGPHTIVLSTRGGVRGRDR